MPTSLIKIMNWLVIVISVTISALLLLTRWPGMTLMDVGPHWLLIWVVAWSIQRTIWQGAIAGLVLGLIQDGLTSSFPTHIMSLMIVGILTASLQKQRHLQEDFISVALIVFLMSFIAEMIMGVQFMLLGNYQIGEIWASHQQIALSSAILSSLWAPVYYFPLSRWWQYVNRAEKKYLAINDTISSYQKR